MYSLKLFPMGNILNVTDSHNRLLWYVEYKTVNVEVGAEIRFKYMLGLNCRELLLNIDTANYFHLYYDAKLFLELKVKVCLQQARILF